MSMLNPAGASGPAPGYAIAGGGTVNIGLSGLANGINGTFGIMDEIEHLTGRGISLRIVHANGGVIVAIKNEDDHRHKSDLHVISESQDLGAEIGKIITMHYLKRKEA